MISRKTVGLSINGAHNKQPVDLKRRFTENNKNKICLRNEVSDLNPEMSLFWPKLPARTIEREFHRELIITAWKVWDVGEDSTFIKNRRKIEAGSSWLSLEQGPRSITATPTICSYQASTNNAIRLVVIIDNALCAPGETFHKDIDTART